MAEAATTPDLTTIKLRTSTLVELRQLKKSLSLKSVKDVIAYLVDYFTADQSSRAQTDVQVQLTQLREDIYGKMDKIHELLAAQEQRRVAKLEDEQNMVRLLTSKFKANLR